MNRRGMTLLEVLCATALTTLIVIATVGWISTQVRSTRRAQERLLVSASLAAVVRAVNDDLAGTVADEASSWTIQEDGSLRVLTQHRAVGDPAGRHVVRWRFSDGMLHREVGAGASRVATRRLDSVAFEVDRQLRVLRMRVVGDGIGEMQVVLLYPGAA